MEKYAGCEKVWAPCALFMHVLENNLLQREMVRPVQFELDKECFAV